MARAVAPEELGGGPTIDDMVGLCDEVDRQAGHIAMLEARLSAIRALVDEQAEDEDEDEGI